MTEKIYNTDGMVREFTAKVLSCDPTESGFEIVLDKTAFFPGGGGQEPDNGTIDGKETVTCFERGDDVIHIIKEPLEVGMTVSCSLDWETRFRRMQHHSGEHIVSGTAHRLFGSENVGFHMDPGFVTMDLDTPLTGEQLDLLEREANLAVTRDVPVRCWLPEEELNSIPYRSKGELTGKVRIVEFEGVDICACCAPHVARSGMVGEIKILDAMKHRGGMRLTVTAGFDAYLDHVQKSENILKISNLLSVKKEDAAKGVEALLLQLEKSRMEAADARKRLVSAIAGSIAPTEGDVILFEEGLFPDDLRELVNAVMEKCRVCFALSGDDENGYKYAAGSLKADMRASSKAINAAIDGRGGGSQTMIQGSAKGKMVEIRQKLNELNSIFA